ncbi:hypothetical protein LCGC14_2891330 [marine sediment metagenome]|uniref:Homing endonuclease LAGLIDADG domain-containing protein n=1 Tax=marine sediment metagenome TaxID=412755 RepID=A0A0F8XXG3_9ZZZZ
MRNVDLAYYAGLFDGEGCININHHKPQRGKRTEQHTLRCYLGMCNEVLVRSLGASFGGSVKYRAIHLKNPKWKDHWIWTIESNQALHWLKMMLPFLRLKKQEALVAIEFQQTRGGQRGRRRISEAEMRKRQQYYELLKSLK